jgi:hypothetical protein
MAAGYSCAMLTTALMLAVALNFEPTRAGVAALILMGRNPLRRLSAFLCGIYAAGLLVGALVLFVFHRALISQGNIKSGQVQIFIGVAAIVVAVFVAANVKVPQLSRRTPPSEQTTTDADGNETEFPQVGFVTKLLSHSTKITNGSPAWVLFVLGVACSLPSIDFMALLLLIAASGAPAVVQVGTLFMFLTLGNLATVLPLLSHRIAPEATVRKVEAFQKWIRSRSRRDIALIVALFGLLIIATGVMNL